MERLQNAIAKSAVRVGGSVFIAIDGLGASGKSTLASLIAAPLEAGIIRLDDLSDAQSFSWMPRLKTEILAPISNGATRLQYQPTAWWGQKPPPPIEQPITPMMIIEGVGAHHPSLRRFWSVAIFIDAPPALCLQRGVSRDLASGRPKNEIERQWRKWQADELTYMKAHEPAANADLVVDGTTPFENQL